MTSAIGQTDVVSAAGGPSVSESGTWESHLWETGKEIASAAFPFLTLYGPLSFPATVGMQTLRTGISAVELANAIKAGDSSLILSGFFKTTVAVVSLAGTLFAHPVGLIVSTGYDLVLELHSLHQHLLKGDHKEALKSSLQILSHCLYLAAFFQGGLEIALCYSAVQILTGIMEIHQEFGKKHFIAAGGQMLMTMLEGKQLACWMMPRQLKPKLQCITEDLDNRQIAFLAGRWLPSASDICRTPYVHCRQR